MLVNGHDLHQGRGRHSFGVWPPIVLDKCVQDGSGEVTQQLKLAALTDDLGLVPSTHGAAHNCQ